MISKERNILRRELEMKNKVEIWFQENFAIANLPAYKLQSLVISLQEVGINIKSGLLEREAQIGDIPW